MTGAVVWITGLPASGKTTLAHAIVDALRGRGITGVVLDGDDVRAPFGIGAHHDATRDAVYARLATLAARTAERGIVAVVAATAHKRAYREDARAQASRFVEVLVATPLSECERRDPKGLYAMARASDTSRLPGVGVAYEPPFAPDVIASGGRDGDAVARVVELAAGPTYESNRAP